MGKYEIWHEEVIEDICKRLKDNKDKEKAIVHIFNPYGTGNWWLSDVDDGRTAFGMCDLGYPELGYVDLDELKDVKITLSGHDFSLEEDAHFEPKNLKDCKESY